jgi:hypothetical protein
LARRWRPVELIMLLQSNYAPFLIILIAPASA